MGKKTVTAEVIILPDLADSAAYAAWMPNVKGKLVMISMPSKLEHSHLFEQNKILQQKLFSFPFRNHFGSMPEPI